MYYILFSGFICLSIFAVTFQTPLHDDESPDIEDIIDKLLASDKFDKLADKIAEKAADKIITLQYSRDEKYVDRAQEVKAEAHKKESVKEESKVKKIVESFPKEESLESKEKAQIDTLAAIHKFEELSSEPLSLNFKHFKTTVSTTRTTKPTTIKAKTKSSKKPKPASTLQRVTMLHRVRAEETDKQTESNSSDEESKEASLDKAIASQEKAKTSEKTNESSSKEKSDSESIETTTKKVKKTTKKEKVKKSKTKVTETTTTTTTTTATESSESEAEVTTKAKSVENKDGEKTDDNKIVTEEKGTTNHDEDVTTRKDYRHMIRQESGKYYAFQQSPDYEEYHEKLAKLLNNVNSKNKRRHG